jgi:integral membrane protein (TIGR01906 family)
VSPPGHGETALAAIAFAAAALVALVLVYSGSATYRDIAVRESLHRQIFMAPAREDPRDGVQGTTYGIDTLVRLHEGTLAYVLGVAPDLPTSPTRGAFYTRAEASHMADVRTVFTIAKAAGVAGLVALVALGARRRRDPRGLAVLARSAAIVSAVGVAALAVFAAVAFEPFFLAFHEVLFPQGNFLFDPANSNMLKLYPEEYWYGVTLRVGVTFLVVAALVAALAQVAPRRLAR